MEEILEVLKTSKKLVLLKSLAQFSSIFKNIIFEMSHEKNFSFKSFHLYTKE